MYIYLDILFVENFIINRFLLSLTAKTVREKVNSIILSLSSEVKAYNDAMMAQYEGDESHVLQYDENGLLQVIPVEFEPQEEVAEATEELEDPFAELPIIDDAELDFLNEEEPAPTLGTRKRIGF